MADRTLRLLTKEDINDLNWFLNRAEREISALAAQDYNRFATFGCGGAIDFDARIADRLDAGVSEGQKSRHQRAARIESTRAHLDVEHWLTLARVLGPPRRDDPHEEFKGLNERRNIAALARYTPTAQRLGTAGALETERNRALEVVRAAAQASKLSPMAVAERVLRMDARISYFVPQPTIDSAALHIVHAATLKGSRDERLLGIVRSEMSAMFAQASDAWRGARDATRPQVRSLSPVSRFVDELAAAAE